MGKPCIYSSILNNRRQYVLKTRLVDQNRHSDWFFIKFVFELEDLDWRIIGMWLENEGAHMLKL